MRIKAKTDTIPEVFILESLTTDNEDYNQFEGQALCNALRLAGKNPKYYYFQDVEELSALATLFDISNYRYLHVSCHGDIDYIPIGDNILTYDEFFSPFTGKLQSKRLFMSACLLGNSAFVEAAMKANDKIASVVAPTDTIDFAIALAFWTAFYIGCFNEQEDKIKDKVLMEKVAELGSVFNETFFVATNDKGELKINVIEDGEISPASEWVDVFTQDMNAMAWNKAKKLRQKCQKIRGAYRG